jgi:hypothetical protein
MYLIWPAVDVDSYVIQNLIKPKPKWWIQAQVIPASCICWRSIIRLSSRTPIKTSEIIYRKAEVGNGPKLIRLIFIINSLKSGGSAPIRVGSSNGIVIIWVTKIDWIALYSLLCPTYCHVCWIPPARFLWVAPSYYGFIPIYNASMRVYSMRNCGCYAYISAYFTPNVIEAGGTTGSEIEIILGRERSIWINASIECVPISGKPHWLICHC